MPSNTRASPIRTARGPEPAASAASSARPRISASAASMSVPTAEAATHGMGPHQATSSGTVLVVATDGSDQNPGTAAAPLMKTTVPTTPVLPTALNQYWTVEGRKQDDVAGLPMPAVADATAWEALAWTLQGMKKAPLVS